VDISPGVFTVIQDLMGMERTTMDMLMNPEFLHALIDKIMEFNLAFIEELYRATGSRIDFYRIFLHIFAY
jgi:uroporphyrinogen-III decarboxylase